MVEARSVGGMQARLPTGGAVGGAVQHRKGSVEGASSKKKHEQGENGKMHELCTHQNQVASYRQQKGNQTLETIHHKSGWPLAAAASRRH